MSESKAIRDFKEALQNLLEMPNNASPKDRIDAQMEVTRQLDNARGSDKGVMGILLVHELCDALFKVKLYEEWRGQ